MYSAIYQGWLKHRRFAPRAHAFRYPLFLAYLDLAELEHVFRGRWLWSTHRRTVARFCRADHLGDPGVSLDDAVRSLVLAETGKRPEGRIALLTHLRYFGYCFNPVSFYYCFDRTERVETVVAEVNNTPWGERHCYVLSGPSLRFRTGKAMHVSPFMPMDVRYEWRFTEPGEHLVVGMALERCGNKIFDATLALQRKPISNHVLVRYPLMTVQVIAAIHWQALRLWLKGVPLHDHPAKLRPGVQP
jgi:DUF1365 family protein